MHSWYLFINNSQIGPLSLSDVRESCLTPDTLVWHDGLPDWVPAARIPELSDLFPTASHEFHPDNAGPATPPPPPGHQSAQWQQSQQWQSNQQQGQPGQQWQQGQQGQQWQQGQQGQQWQQPNYAGNFYVSNSGKDKVAAGILAILLGGLGVQYFYIGKIGAGFITLLLSFVTCGLWSVITLVQGILMLTMTQQEFDQKYVYSTSTFPLF